MPESSRIFVVDDDGGGRYLKAHLLRKSGYATSEFDGGLAALSACTVSPPDLILLDTRLPDLHGSEVCRRVKAGMPDVMVLQTSAALTTAQDRAAALESGADAFLVEPIEPEELLATVKALLRLRTAEQGLRKANDSLEAQVAERTRELRDANHRLEAASLERQRAEETLWHAQKLDAVGQLTGGIAHDFNNLLMGIAGSLELLQSRLAQGRTAELDRYIGTALSGAKRASALTHRLLAFARRQPLDPKLADLNQLVSGMAELIARTLGPTIRLDLSLADGLWPTLIDANQLENVLLNLCVNARDAMPSGGGLAIATENLHLVRSDRSGPEEIAAGDYTILAVTDTGIGMPPDVIARAFEPFFTTKPFGQGTGLGLSMVYGFVKQSGGHVQIRSKEGRGTIVRLYLARSHHARQEQPPHPVAVAKNPVQASEGETILVVEDEADVRTFIVEVLRDLGYQALEASNGQAGVEILHSAARIDLLLTDVGLPGLNGRQVADAARRLRPDLKVLFVTGYAHGAAIGTQAMEPGTELIVKPFRMEELASKMRSILEAAPLPRKRVHTLN